MMLGCSIALRPASGRGGIGPGGGGAKLAAAVLCAKAILLAGRFSPIPMDPARPKLVPKTQTEDIAGKAFDFATMLAAFVFAYLFFEVVILTFGAILVAVMVSLVATPLKQRLRLHGWAAITLAVLILALLAGGTVYLFGTRLAVDLQDVLSRMEGAQNNIRASLQSSEFGKIVLSHLGGTNIPIAKIAANVFSLSARFVAGLVVAAVAGIYMAAQPSLYFEGFLLLFPRDERSYAEETVAAVGNGLYRWLEGQFVSMVLVGLFSALALWAIGLPSPFGLGLIAGATEFVPYVGPIIAAIPALLVAATQSLSAVLWTFIAYIAIHAIEGYVISPLVQREMVYVPPAIMLLGIASISIVFGTVAILFAAPIVVVLFVLIKKLYVRDSLGEPTPLPGEKP